MPHCSRAPAAKRWHQPRSTVALEFFTAGSLRVRARPHDSQEPPMCRWNAYFGQPVLIDELLFRTEHSLIDQSLHSRMGVETTNGDGFGLGWYTAGNGGTPARYRSVTPAWSDQNLRDLASHVESPLFLAHIRATTGTPVQQTNCHPFRHGRWLFVHNGVINGFQAMRRDLLYAVDSELFDGVHGSTDSEALFYLALTFGLADDPLGAVERAVGFVETTAREHGIEHPVQMTLGFSDGERLYAVRYSTEHSSRTLFVSEDVAAVRALHPDNERFQRMTDEDRVVVSEPVSDLPGVWREVPESTALIIQRGPDEQREFTPRTAASAVH
jgi:predicted glutamine amidotransferase